MSFISARFIEGRFKVKLGFDRLFELMLSEISNISWMDRIKGIRKIFLNVSLSRQGPFGKWQVHKMKDLSYFVRAVEKLLMF